MAIIAACILAIIAIITAHGAGGGYVVAAREGRSSKYAIVRSVASILLIGQAILILARH